MPEWRKELGERVREVQERRLREAAVETESIETEAGADGSNGTKAALLELLPQAEVLPMNPVLVAALRRIERANDPAHAVNFTDCTGATAVAYAEHAEFRSDASSVVDDANTAAAAQEVKPQRTLAAVPNPPSSSEVLAPKGDTSSNTLKPKRLIGDDLNDPALNYLDTIPTAPRVQDCEKRSAPIPLRILSALIDLVVICLLSLLPLALVKLTDLTWWDPRVITFAVSTSIVVAFLYLTICTAFTGRTLGMRLFSLRVVDARTRMIPTGSQSAGRAAVYILSVVSIGLPLMYRFIDRDKRTAHDRFTRTEVVRM